MARGRVQRRGTITTFYSFKGGVGRTMALANVAFVAAMNGLRVLVMDWDLEAPGLSFYFRGLPDLEQAQAIKNSPGILNLAWSWQNRLDVAKESSDVDVILHGYDTGAEFDRAVRSVVDLSRLPKGGRLDIIGAGSPYIKARSEQSYAEALACFSWTDFFETYGGGLFIEKLRDWAKSNYDIVLIDSRTGYADIAGVCTVQMPDVVLLTFIYNRQNIEGITAVAQSIRAARAGGVRLRAVPMRLSREGTPDEADARSRAIRGFQRGGAFSYDEVVSDMDNLAISAAPSVPFYETLSPFSASSPTKDQLTLDYISLAQEVCNRHLQAPDIQVEWRDIVRRRLQPRLATVGYVQELQSADPARAAEEVDRLVDSACDADLHEGGVDPDYLKALVEAAFDLSDRAEDESALISAHKSVTRVVELLRTKFSSEPDTWRDSLVEAIERRSTIYIGDDAAYLAQMLELDNLLAKGEQTNDVILRRVAYKRTISVYERATNPRHALRVMGEAEQLLKMIKGGDNGNEVANAWAETLLQKAYVLRAINRSVGAKKAAKAALGWIEKLSPREKRLADRTYTSLEILLAGLESSPHVAADHVISALKSSSSLSLIFGNLPLLSKVLLASGPSNDRVRTFARAITTEKKSHLSAVRYFSRSIGSAASFADVAAELALYLSSSGSTQNTLSIRALVVTGTSILSNLRIRLQGSSRAHVSKKAISSLTVPLTVLADAAGQAHVDSETISPLVVAVSELDRLVPNVRDARA